VVTNSGSIGGCGDDRHIGGKSSDHLHGGTGNDGLAGGPAPEHFIFEEAQDHATNVDGITDFTHLVDKIDLSHAIFAAAASPGAALRRPGRRRNRYRPALGELPFMQSPGCIPRDRAVDLDPHRGGDGFISCDQVHSRATTGRIRGAATHFHSRAVVRKWVRLVLRIHSV
jgi:hypothetical protein